MKILTLLNYLQKLPRTARLFVRARNFGLNEITDIEQVVVRRSRYISGNGHQEYGRFEYGDSHDLQRGDAIEGFELIFKDKK